MNLRHLLRSSGAPIVGLSLLMCSAPDDKSAGRVNGGQNGGPGESPIITDPGPIVGGDDPGGVITDGPGTPGQVPINIGTETVCDGIDDNANGIIDDVDRGNDGLCDCLNIGFLGDLASDAGGMTSAFEDWLEARSDTPVTNLPATTVLTPEILAPLQVLVIGNMTARVGKPYSADELAALDAWVKQRGGGVMSLGGYTALETAMQPTVELMAFTGMSYDYMGRGPGVLGVGAPPMTITGIVMPTHPTMTNVKAVGVYYGYPVTGDGDVLVEQTDFILAMAKVLGGGKALAFADEWVTQNKLWLPDATPKPLTQCQRDCAQCDSECTRCDGQCMTCQAETCQGGQPDQDPLTCPRGCDGGCDACQTQCTVCEQRCTTCKAAEIPEVELDMAQFWLNIMGWLTPDNECKVKIPPDVRAK